MKPAAHILAFMAFALAGLAACGGGPPKPTPVTGETASAVYVRPATYQAHRDQQRIFQTADGKLAYTDHGEGPVLVMLHGVPTSSWMYRNLIPELQTNMRVISVDLLGFGSSDKPEDEGGKLYSAEARAARIRALLAALDVKEYGLLMHDMGGLVAWEMLAADQSAVTHLVVLNTIVNDNGFTQPDISPGNFTRMLVNAYNGPLSSVAIMTKTFNDLGLKGEHKLSEAECFGYVAPIREGASPALYDFFTSVNDEMMARLENNRSRFSDYQGKTLVMWGAKDDILTTEQIPILQDMLDVQDVNIHIYEDNAHFLAEEIPDEIVAKVTALVSGLPERQAH